MVHGKLAAIIADMTLDLPAIKKRWAATRLALGYRPKQIEVLTGISMSLQSQWEDPQSKKYPTLTQADKLRRALDLTLEWIYYGELRGLTYERHQQLRDVA